MKTIIVITLVLLASASFASTLEYDRVGDTTQMQICVEKPISGKLGAFAYSCQGKTWSETYAGLTYAPHPEVQIAFGAGQETGGNRVGGWIWAGKGRFSAIYLYEDGKTGTWDKYVLKYQATKRLALGWTKKQYAGEGVYADFKVSKEITVKYSGFKTPELALNIRF